MRVDVVRAGLALMVLLCPADRTFAQAPPPSRRGGSRGTGQIVGGNLPQFVQPEVRSCARQVGRVEDVTVLDFENTSVPASGRSSGTPVPITTQYADQGITFNAPFLIDYSQPQSIPGFPFGKRALELCHDNEQCQPVLVMRFAQSQKRVQVRVGHAGSRRVGLVLFEGFDENHRFVDRCRLALPTGEKPVPIRFPMELIATDRLMVETQLRPQLATDVAGLAIDDVTFQRRVPAPSPQPAPEAQPAPQAPPEPPPVISDLFINEVTPSVGQGRPASISVSVGVAGAATSEPTTVHVREVRVDAWGDATMQVGPLFPGSEPTVVIVQLPPDLAPGDYRFEVTLDSPPGVTEASLENNQMGGTLQVPAPPSLPLPPAVLPEPVPQPSPPPPPPWYDEVDWGTVAAGAGAAAVLLALVLFTRSKIKQSRHDSVPQPQVVPIPRVDPGTQTLDEPAEEEGQIEVGLRPRIGVRTEAVSFEDGSDPLDGVLR